MRIVDSLAFWGNVVGFCGAFVKVLYDLYFNPRRFRREEKIFGLLGAARRKRYRADLSTGLTFLAMMVGYFLSIAALVAFK